MQGEGTRGEEGGIAMELKKTQLMRKTTRAGRKNKNQAEKKGKERQSRKSKKLHTNFICGQSEPTGCSQHLTPSAEVKMSNNIEAHKSR